jgi:phage-related protein (TIGR01555 family)
VSKDQASGRLPNGRWAKNTSGNPKGRRPGARADAAAPESTEELAVTHPQYGLANLPGRPEMLQPRAQMLPLRSGRPGMRMDEWRNLLTGQGIAGRDKRMGAFFLPTILSFDQLADLWQQDDLAARAVETEPKQARRPGYDLDVADEGESDEQADDLAQEAKDRAKELGVDSKIQKAGEYCNAYGGGVMLLGVNDGQKDMIEPLNLNKVQSFDWIRAIEARACIPTYAYGDQSAANYGDPEIYQLTARNLLPTRTGSGFSTAFVHESRLIVFDGIRVSDYRQVQGRQGWGDSKLSRMWRVLRDFNAAFSSAGVVVTDFSQCVIKIKELWKALSEDEGGAFEDRLTAMELGRSAINAITIDSEDDWQRQTASVTGLPDLLEKFMVRLAAAAGMPLTMLFGTSPAGMNATGESDIRSFYDSVDVYRTEVVEPALRKIYQLIFRTIGNKREPKKWSIKFKPLWQESPKEIASAMLTQAQADNTWVSMGAITPDEVTQSHWGQGEYNPNLTVDHKARDAQATATEGAVSPEDMEAMGRGGEVAPAAGPQQPAIDVAKLLEIIKAGVSGAIPRESAEVVLTLAFPQIDGAQATKLLGPPKPVAPPPTPPAPSGGPPSGPPPGAPRADGFNPDQPRAPDGRFGEVAGEHGGKGAPGGSVKERAAASMKNKEFLTKHRERLIAAGERAKDPFGGKNSITRYGEEARAAEKAAHEREAEAIHQEDDEREEIARAVSGPHVERLSRMAENAAFGVPKGTTQHQHVLAQVAEERAVIEREQAALSAGHITAPPTEKLEAFKANQVALAARVKEVHQELGPVQLAAAKAVADAEAVHVAINDGDEGWNGEALVDEALADAYGSVDTSLTGDEDSRSSDAYEDIESSAVDLSELPEEPGSIDDIDEVEDPGAFEEDEDETAEETAERRAQYDEERAAYEAYRKEVAELPARVEAYEKAVEDRRRAGEALLRTRSEAAQSALEALHEKQIAAAAELKLQETANAKARTAMINETSLDPEDIVNIDEDSDVSDDVTESAYAAAESLLSDQRSMREDMPGGLPSDNTVKSLRDAAKTTAEAIKTLSKVTGRAPKLAALPKLAAPKGRKAKVVEPDDEEADEE